MADALATEIVLPHLDLLTWNAYFTLDRPHTYWAKWLPGFAENAQARFDRPFVALVGPTVRPEPKTGSVRAPLEEWLHLLTVAKDCCDATMLYGGGYEDWVSGDDATHNRSFAHALARDVHGMKTPMEWLLGS